MSITPFVVNLAQHTLSDLQEPRSHAGAVVGIHLTDVPARYSL
jgi:hypothetical protein